jgi:tetratricopeptide (TPR) repeat protein
MKKSKTILKSQLPLLGALLAFGVSVWVKNKIPTPALNISKQDSATTVNTDFLKLFSAGNRRMVADFVWIKTLLESDLEHYKNDNLNNWMYLRFNQISDLDPLFYQNYLYGGLYLSVVKDDPKSGIKIFEKALLFYPKDYKLRFNLGFTYYFDLGDFKRGLNHLKHIQNSPELPIPMKSVIAKLQLQTTLDYDLAFSMVNENYKNTEDPALRKKLFLDLYAIKAEKDLKCLNMGSTECEQTDLQGKPYLFQNNTYTSVKSFNPFRVKIRSTKPIAN